jgi:hypothetical protein
MSKFIVILIMSCLAFLSACTGLNQQDLRQIISVSSLNNQISIKRQQQFVISPLSTIALKVTPVTPSRYSTSEYLRDDKQLILNSFKQHFQRVELFDNAAVIGVDFDFIVNVNLLNVIIKPEKHSRNQSAVKTNLTNTKIASVADVVVRDAQTLAKNIELVDDAADALVDNATMKTDSAVVTKTNLVATATDVIVKETKMTNLETKNVTQAQINEADVANPAPEPLIPLQALIKLSLIDARSNRIIDVAFVDSYSSSIRKPNYDNFLMDMINLYANEITIM